MPDLPEELIRANAILREYVAIHDAIFKFSWRKTLPIPGIFKATDFGAHFRDLGRLASELAALSSALKESQGLWRVPTNTRRRCSKLSKLSGRSAGSSTRRAKVI